MTLGGREVETRDPAVFQRDPRATEAPPPGYPTTQKEKKKERNLPCLFALLRVALEKRHISFLYREGGPTPNVGVAPVGEVPEEIWSWVTQSK